MDELVETDVAGRRFVLLLIGGFAAIAVALAVVGVYGVTSYWVRQRTQEIGIRMALGARERSVIWLVTRQNAGWVLVGVAAGIASAVGLTRLLAGQLYAVRPTDPPTFALAALTQVTIALLAAYIPAKRAARLDPMAALRYE
jgi:putative ABC transport system permease protein